jgi:hypothetical protein
MTSHQHPVADRPIHQRTPRRRLRALLGVPFAVVFGVFMLSASAGPAGAASAGTFSGKIEDQLGRPLANVRIDVLSPQLPPFFSDDNGNYTSPTLSAGSHPFRVAAPCKAPASSSITIDGNNVSNLVLPTANISDSSGMACRVPDPVSGLFGTTAAIALTGDDEQATVNLPFAFPFYGQLRTSANVSTNGFLSFGGPATAFLNGSLPSATAPNAAIYPFWDDLVVDASASVRTATVGSAPGRAFVVEWRNVLIHGTADRLTFAVAMFENGGIRVQYSDIDSLPDEQGASATIGLENGSGTVALQQSSDIPVLKNGTSRFYDVNFPPTAGAGPDQRVASGESFTLDGVSQTSDPNDTVEFLWSQTSGPTVVLDERNGEPVIAGVRGPARLDFELTVVDGYGATSTDTVTVTVDAPSSK